jgi:hypothetical protein
MCQKVLQDNETPKRIRIYRVDNIRSEIQEIWRNSNSLVAGLS